MKKYELTGESKVTAHGGQVFRILAMRDIPLHQVKKGDLGGFVAGYANLAQEGECWVSDNASVEDEAFVCNDAWVGAKAMVSGKSRIQNQALIYRSARVHDSTIKNDAEVFGRAVLYRTTVEGRANIKGEAEIINCRIKATGNGVDLFVIKDKVFLMASVIQGEDVLIEGKVHIKETDIGAIDGSSKDMVICNEALLQGVTIQGSHIIINKKATLTKGVRLMGDDIRIGGYAVLNGWIRLGSGVTIRECVSVTNPSTDKYLEYSQTLLQGDVTIE